MKIIKRVYRFMFKKDVIFFLGGFSLFLVFRIPLEKLFELSFIEFLFKDIEKTWYNDIIFALIILGITIHSVYNFRKFQPDFTVAKYWLIFIMILLLYRFQVFQINDWEFASMKFVAWIKYTDVFFFFFLSYCFSLIPSKKRTESDSALLDDRPISKDSLDGNEVLGYQAYAQIVCKKIQASSFNNSFAIGVNGKWGIGKTTFFNCLKNILNGDNILEIDFNPWNSQSPNLIIEDLFEVLQDKFQDESLSLSRLLNRYSNKLVSIESNSLWLKILNVFSVRYNETIDNIFKEINSKIDALDKKLIIYIDDLDRLDKNEIFEVLRLIRNTANFKNTFFIVAYDRDYLINALEKHNSINKEFFLEKIFQLEVSLPYFRKDILRERLAKNLQLRFPEYLHKEIEDVIVGSINSHPDYLDEWLVNIRDVTRLSNSMLINYSRLFGNVVFSEFLRMELLRIKFPGVYEVFFKEKGRFLQGASGIVVCQPQRYALARDENTKNSFENSETKLYIYLKENRERYGLTEFDIEKITELLRRIFSDSSHLSFGVRNSLSISYPSKFDRYFAFNLLKGDLCEIEFSMAREKDQETFNSHIDNLVNDGTESELRQKFYDIDEFDDFNDFKKVIKAILYFANIPLGKDERILSFEHNVLRNKLVAQAIPVKDIPKQLELFKYFMKDTFKCKSIGYNYQIDFLSYLCKDETKDLLNESELEELTLEYLKRNFEVSENWNKNLWHFYDACKQKKLISFERRELEEYIPEKAKQIIRSFALEKDPNGFVLDILENNPGNKEKFQIHPNVIGVFNDGDSLLSSIRSSNYKEFSYKDEFIQFLEKYKSKGYSGYISFNFKIIHVVEKKVRFK